MAKLVWFLACGQVGMALGRQAWTLIMCIVMNSLYFDSGIEMLYDLFKLRYLISFKWGKFNSILLLEVLRFHPLTLTFP